MSGDFISTVRAVVGDKNVLVGERDTEAFVTDWRKQYRAGAECVARPASANEVAEVVRLCAAADVAIVPQGGNTGLCGGSVPTGERREIVISLARMNRIRELDALNDTITVEAGCVLAQVQRAAADAGRLFPLSLAAEGTCQIGGNLSTNAGGVNVLRYGNAREQVLGLEAVLPDGRIWDGLRALRKDNTGYDLKQLFIGAEGTLGIITAAVLRLHPKPTASATAWLRTADPARVVALLGHFRQQCGDRLTAFELVSQTCVNAVASHRPGLADPIPSTAGAWCVLVQLDDSGTQAELASRLEQTLAGALEHSLASDAVVAKSESEVRKLWAIRESIPEAQFANVKHDISVPISRIPDFVMRAGEALEKSFPGTPVFCFGHVGDGNLHYNVGDKALTARRADVNRVIYEAVAALGGSISAEHGLGQLKREQIRQHKDPLELELMRALKRTLDPRGLMNPGKLL